MPQALWLERQQIDYLPAVLFVNLIRQEFFWIVGALSGEEFVYARDKSRTHLRLLNLRATALRRPLWFLSGCVRLILCLVTAGARYTRSEHLLILSESDGRLEVWTIHNCLLGFVPKENLWLGIA